MAFTGTGKIWMNGSLVDWADAKIHIASHVIHYGSAVFEGARCYDTPRGSACFQLDAHMRRLFDSAKIYRMEPLVDRPTLTGGRARHDPRQRLQGVLHPADRLSRLPHARRQPVGLPGRFGHPHVGVGCLSRQGSPGARRRRRGQLVDARGAEHLSRRSRRARPTTPTRSSSRCRRLPTATAKASRSTPPAISAKAAARTSSSSATRFSTRRRCQPPILPGITRNSVITIARDLGFQVREELLPRELLYIADEAFFVGTAVEITPIRSVDKIVVGKGRRGPITEALQAAFFDIINGVRPDTHGWLTYVSPEPLPRRHCSRRMHLNDLLRIAAASGASDLHLKVGSYPMMRVNGTPRRRLRRKAARPPRHRGDGERALHARAPGEVPQAAGSRPRLQRHRPRPLPLQRLPAARHRRHGAARHPDARPQHRRARAPAGPQAHRRGGARPRARHRHDRQRQEHDARGDDRPRQLDARGAHHDGRGPDRVPASGPPVDRQPARSRGGHGVVLARAAQRAAAGSRRHPRRRDARLRNGRDGAPRGRNRPPRVLDAAHARRDRDHQPHHLGVSAAPAAPDSHSAVDACSRPRSRSA